MNVDLRYLFNNDPIFVHFESWANMNAEADLYKGPLFDADNHYYEAEDAFTRYVPKRMQKR